MNKIMSSDEYRQKMSETHKRLWQDDKFIQKALRTWNQHRLPNNSETFLAILTPLNVRYVGNGSFWRTLPDGRHTNPDFIVEPIEKTRKVIYHHGIYWHQEELDDRGEKLVNQWKEIGYDCLIIWEDELVDDLDSVLDKIAEFIGKSTWQLSLPI